MNQTRSVADARYKHLLALMAIAAGGAGSSDALSHFKWIDGSTVQSGNNGSIAQPYKTIGAFVGGMGASTNALENSIPTVGIVTPKASLTGYTENVTAPAYRSMELRALNFTQLVTGNFVWHNVAGGGAVAPSSGSAAQFLHNVAFTGNITCTDDGVVPSSLFLSNDEAEALSCGGNVDVSGCTAMSLVSLFGSAVQGNIVSTSNNATGANVVVNDGEVVGSIVARSVSALDSSFINGNITVASAANGGSCTFVNCTFSGQTITGGAGTILKFDAASYRSFVETGGSVAGAGVIVLVIGGFSGAAVEGANLTNADVSLSIDGTAVGTTAGFTAGGNHYTLPAATLGADHVCKLLLGGNLKKGDTILITRTDSAAHLYTVQNSLGAAICIFPVSQKGSCLAQYNGADWVAIQPGAGVT